MGVRKKIKKQIVKIDQAFRNLDFISEGSNVSWIKENLNIIKTGVNQIKEDIKKDGND